MDYMLWMVEILKDLNDPKNEDAVYQVFEYLNIDLVEDGIDPVEEALYRLDELGENKIAYKWILQEEQ